jgi:hypothetical protein
VLQTVFVAVFGIQYFDVMCVRDGCESVIILVGFDVHNSDYEEFYLLGYNAM